LLASTSPERPTNGSPAISSSRPGASPTNITLACGLPSANTSRFAVRRRAQPSNRSSRSRSASRLVAEAAARRAAMMAASGAGGAPSPVPPPPAAEGREARPPAAWGGGGGGGARAHIWRDVGGTAERRVCGRRHLMRQRRFAGRDLRRAWRRCLGGKPVDRSLVQPRITPRLHIEGKERAQV